MDVYSFHQSLLNGALNLFTWTQWSNESLELLLKFLLGLRMAITTTQWQQIYGFQMVLQCRCVNMHSGFVITPFFYWNGSKQLQTSAISKKIISDGHQLPQSIHKFAADPMMNCSLAVQVQKLHQYFSDYSCPHFKQEFRNKEKVMETVLNFFPLASLLTKKLKFSTLASLVWT